MDKILYLDDYILKRLEDNTEIPWKWSLIGPAFPNVITGFLCSHSIDYSAMTKDSAKGTATFDIWIIAPDLSGSMATEKKIESLTLKVKDILIDDYTLGGHALKGRVESVSFAPPAGKNNAGASHIVYTVDFEDYEEEE